MDNDLIKEVIEVSDITEKRFETGKQAKVKGNGKTFTVYEKKQDGTTSVAWAALEKVGIGATIEVSYVEKPGEYEGKPYTSRIVRIINEDVGNGVKNHKAQQTPLKNDSVASHGQSNDAFGRRLAIHGFVNAMLSHGATIEIITHDLPALGKLEDAIDRFLNEPAALTSMREKFGEDLPVIHIDDEVPMSAYDENEVNVDDIPF